LKYGTLQYLYAPFCKSGQNLKSGYILAGAKFVKWLELEPKSGISLFSFFYIPKKIAYNLKTAGQILMQCNVVMYLT